METARIDVVIVKQNDIETVMADGNGFSTFDHLTPIMKKPGKKVWQIKKGANLPAELRLIKDLCSGHEGHFMIAPTANMPFAKFIGLLQELAVHCKKIS